MERVFEAINGVFSFIGPLSDFLWEFPTNFVWYSSIPILGNISFAIILLLGSGIFFSFRIGFMQVTYFKKGIRTMTEKRVVETGISPLASFFLSQRQLPHDPAIPSLFPQPQGCDRSLGRWKSGIYHFPSS